MNSVTEYSATGIRILLRYLLLMKAQIQNSFTDTGKAIILSSEACLYEYQHCSYDSPLLCFWSKKKEKNVAPISE